MVEQLENPNLKPNLANYETPNILYIVIYLQLRIPNMRFYSLNITKVIR